MKILNLPFGFNLVCIDGIQIDIIKLRFNLKNLSNNQKHVLLKKGFTFKYNQNNTVIISKYKINESLDMELKKLAAAVCRGVAIRKVNQKFNQLTLFNYG